jgi:hypothetical protein
MKHIVRAFVVVLALTGAVSTSYSSAKTAQASGKSATVKTSAVPVPMCPPDDPNGCGIDGN